MPPSEAAAFGPLALLLMNSIKNTKRCRLVKNEVLYYDGKADAYEMDISKDVTGSFL